MPVSGILTEAESVEPSSGYGEAAQRTKAISARIAVCAIKRPNLEAPPSIADAPAGGSGS
jgi:hypothetical protein